MDYSFITLGSTTIKERVLEDIEGLFEIAETKKIIPIFLLIGPLFLDITSIQSLILELSIENFQKELDENYEIVSSLVQDKRHLLYKQCNESDGLFDFDESRKVNVIFDPDEAYLSLLCIETPKTEKEKKNPEYIILKYKDGEILPELQNIFEDQ